MFARAFHRNVWILPGLMLSISLMLPAPVYGGQDGVASGTTTKWLNSLFIGCPISANNGSYYFVLPLLSPGGPMELNFTLRYRSTFRQTAYWGGHGKVIGLPEMFWWTPLETLEYGHYDLQTEFVSVQILNGDVVSFKKQGDQWLPTQKNDFGYVDNTYPFRWLLKELGNYFYLLDPVGEMVHVFQKVDEDFARILRIMDRNGNQLVYSYAADEDLHPSRVEDLLGRSFDFTYEKVGDDTALVHVADQTGRAISFSHENEGADNNDLWTLRSFTDPMDLTTVFSYANGGNGWDHQIASVERPEGNVPFTQHYALSMLNGANIPRVISQEDAYNNTINIGYDPAVNRVTETRPDSATVIYEHYSNRGIPKSLTDATGKTFQAGRDEENNRITSVTDRLGDTTQISYHPETGKLASYTDAQGNTTTFTYTAQSQTFANPLSPSETVSFTFYNLTAIAYADGTHDNFSYNAKGNLITWTDRLGKMWKYTYNNRGQVLTLTNPNSGVTTDTYNADANLASQDDSDVGLTGFAYDTYKRLSTVNRPGGNVQIAYDLNDRLLSVTDERGKNYAFAYDENGNLNTATNPLNQTAIFDYDLMDRLSERTDSLGKSAGMSYDEVGRLKTLTDRNNNTSTYTYDLRGWLTEVLDPTGKVWKIAYDDEGVPASFSTPLGNTTTFTTDKLGRTTAIANPLGKKILLDYDDLGRLVTAKDRMGRTTSYNWDAAGRLIKATQPVIGSAIYKRNASGSVTRITDVMGKNWDFTSTPMGRQASQTDPLGHQRTYTYNTGGRIGAITYPDAKTASYTYDASGNLMQLVFSDGPTLKYSYDAAGRMASANYLSFVYNARGDLVNSRNSAASFKATYDPGQRLKTVIYDGQMTVTYTYDRRNLLTRVQDSRAKAWMNFAYDMDRRLAQITRSNGTVTKFTYNKAGRVTRINDLPLADQQYTLNPEGEATKITRKLPLDPSPALPVTALGFDAANQINSAGYSYDARGRQIKAPGKTFAYNGADQIKKITAAGSTVTFTYNGRDDLLTRTAGGVATTYAYNYALKGAPIVAEKVGSAYKRFYVYTPQGELLYSVDVASNAMRFYHFDQIGSTLFLTDASGAVSDAYAYDPYGVLLERTGTSDQPFTFIGQYGVRWETVGSLYHMRARFYDSASARFITRDPAWPDLSDPQGLNPYEYAHQNPLRYIDPTGMQPNNNETFQNQKNEFLNQGNTQDQQMQSQMTQSMRQVNRKLIMIKYWRELLIGFSVAKVFVGGGMMVTAPLASMGYMTSDTSAMTVMNAVLEMTPSAYINNYLDKATASPDAFREFTDRLNTLTPPDSPEGQEAFQTLLDDIINYEQNNSGK